MATVTSERPTSKASNRTQKAEAPKKTATPTQTREAARTATEKKAETRAAGPATTTAPKPTVDKSKDTVDIDPPGQPESLKSLNNGLGSAYDANPARMDHDHGGHHHDDSAPYWTGTPLGTDPPNPNVPEKPPEGLSDAEKELYDYRRGVGPQHVEWHNKMPKMGTETTKDWVDFFDYHKGLVDSDNKEREKLGLPPLGPMDPPPPETLCPLGRNGKPLMGEVPRPDPLDPKYKGNFDQFSKDIKKYHDLYHGMNPDIGHPNSNVMEDKFYEFHAWIEQQYQTWRADNPDWKPPT